MRLRVHCAVIGTALLASCVSAIAQVPTCTTSGTTMTCTFPASSGGSSPWNVNGANIANVNSGNVGIGTASPVHKLQVNTEGSLGTFVYGDNVYRTLYLGERPAGGNLASIHFDPAKSGNNLGFDVGVFDNNSAGRYYYIFDNNAAAERFRISSTGSVGIGTSNPGAVLDVAGTPTSNGVIRAFSGYSGGTGLVLQNTSAGGHNWFVFSQGSDNSTPGGFGLYDTTAGAYRFVVDASGNVGVGTTGPSQRLHVIGNIAASGSISAYYQDVAEWVPVRSVLAPGTVVVASDGGVVGASQAPYDTAVVGVVSPQPGIMLGEAGPDKTLVAQSGRVRVKVDASFGAIRVGDLLVTSAKAGVAMRSEPLNVGGATFHRPGTLLGKALEPLADGEGEILVLLTLQ